MIGSVSDCYGARPRGKSSVEGFCWEGRTRTCWARASDTGRGAHSIDVTKMKQQMVPIARNLERLGAERTAIAFHASARGLLVFVAEMGADYPRLKVLESPQVFDDIAAGVIEEKFAILGAPDRDYPFEVIAIFEQVIDGLGNAPTRNYRDLGAG